MEEEKRAFIVHYGGNWSPKLKRYAGGNSFWLYDLVWDELNLLDIRKDILNHSGLSNVRIQWWSNGKLETIENDRQLLEMWDHIKAQDKLYHLYIENLRQEIRPNITPNTTQESITLQTTQYSPQNTPNSPHISSNLVLQTPIIVEESTTPPSKSTKVPAEATPSRNKGKKVINLTPTRRSPRLFKSKFTNVSEDPIHISEDEVDWAFDNLFKQQQIVLSSSGGRDWQAEWDTQWNAQKSKTESEFVPLSEEIVNVNDDALISDTFIGDLYLLEGLDAEEAYHSSKSDSELEYFSENDGDDEPPIKKPTEQETDVGKPRAESSTKPRASSSRSINKKNIPTQHTDFSEFFRETQNLYEDEDKEEEFADVGPKQKPMSELYGDQIWATMEAVRKFMRDYAIWKKFEYKQVSNDNTIIHLRCRDSECDWFFYVRRQPNKHTAMLRRVHDSGHTCQADPKGKNRMANAGWVADKIEQCIRNHKAFKPKDIRAEIWEQYGVNISYWTAWQAKVTCHERIYGSYNEGYLMVPEIARKVLECNPGSFVNWLRDPFDKSFTMLCVGFKGSLDGFVKGCRPIIGLDGCFLKGKYGGVILAATSLDANNGLFPLAMCVTTSETYDNWSRFLSYLGPFVKKHASTLTFMSDRGKGLIAAVQSVFPNSHHRYCFRHMYKNFKTDGFTGPHLEKLSWGAANAYKPEEFDEWMATLERDDEQAFRWLKQEPFELWARSHFDTTSKCEHTTNNFSESLNKMMLVLREMPLVYIAQQYQLLVMGLLYNRKKVAEGQPRDGLITRVKDRIERLKRHRNKFIIEPSTDFLYLATNKWNATWTINTKEHTCTCCEWQIKGIPCIHAVAVIIPMRELWAKFCSPFFTWGAYADSYESYVTPFDDPKYWPKPAQGELVNPPHFRRPIGRRRKERIPGADEPAKGPKNAPKTCSKCGIQGHNMRKCKGPAAVDEEGRPFKRRSEAEGPEVGNASSNPEMVQAPVVERITSQGPKKKPRLPSKAKKPTQPVETSSDFAGTSARSALLIPGLPPMKGSTLGSKIKKGPKKPKKAFYFPPGRPTL